MAHDEVLLFKKLANNLIVAATLTCTPIAAYSATASIGLDLGVRSLHFADEYGKDHFAKHYYHISPYLELQLNKNLGLQVGYETSDKRSNLKLYGMNDNFLGAPPSPNGQVIRFFSKAKINGGFLGFFINNTFWQQYSFPVDLSLFAGVALLKLRMSNTEVTGNGDPSGNQNPTFEDMDTAKKACPKITIAAKFPIPKIAKGLSFKISYGWEQTSNLSAQRYTMAGGGILGGGYPSIPLMIVKVKNSHYGAIGLNYNLL